MTQHRLTIHRSTMHRPAIRQLTSHQLTGHNNRSGCLGLLAWPFVALGKVVAGVIKLAGRMLALLLGFVLMIVGALLCLTIIGAFVGVPLLLLGLALVVRSLF